MTIGLTIIYKGDLDSALDKVIEKAVGKPSDGSGFCFFDNSRDVHFSFYNCRNHAEEAKQRVKKVGIKKRLKYIIEMEDYDFR